MSTIFEIISAQKEALGAVPGAGQRISLGSPVIGVDPEAQIYLQSPIEFESIDGGLATRTHVIWTAILPVPSGQALERALNTQDAMIDALVHTPCHYGMITRGNLDFADPDVSFWLINVRISFTLPTSTGI